MKRKKPEFKCLVLEALEHQGWIVQLRTMSLNQKLAYGYRAFRDGFVLFGGGFGESAQALSHARAGIEKLNPITARQSAPADRPACDDQNP